MEFRDLQRARYLMTTLQLSNELLKERGCGTREIFGASVTVRPDTEEELEFKRRARFNDELCALRAFVRAYVLLHGASGCRAMELASASAGVRSRAGSSAPTVRQSGRPERSCRSFDETATSRLMEDLVDVGVLIGEIPRHRLELLIERYIFGRTAGEIASQLGCDPSSVGGRLSQARRALRLVLAPLLPQAAAGETPRHPLEEEDGIEWRREKVARLLRKRMEDIPDAEEKCS